MHGDPEGLGGLRLADGAIGDGTSASATHAEIAEADTSKDGHRHARI